jgi:3-deoxy-7-phosphoheptulonate synthase
VLVDFHPDPGKALVDGPQALRLEELPHFLQDVAIAREAYLRRVELAKQYVTGALPSVSGRA